MIGERFTKEARQAVRDAIKVAEQDQVQVSPQHLLLALLDKTPVLSGVPREDVEAAFRDARRKGGLSKTDVEALRSLGIDVDEIVDSVERSLGEGALSKEKPRKRWFGVAIDGDVKKTLERSLREARDLGHNHLGNEHLVLALLQGKGVVTEVLEWHGVHYADVRKQVADRA
ncbi:peptidase [Lentzea sp. NBRC 105346]|nr:peptidase [Lentzea sp. NBRC 105346]